MYLPTNPEIDNRFVRSEETNLSDERELTMQETDEDSKRLDEVFNEDTLLNRKLNFFPFCIQIKHFFIQYLFSFIYLEV